MIVVTCGTEKYPFDRLVKTVDIAVKNASINEKVLIQANALNYKPLYCRYEKILPYATLVEMIKKSSIYICHGGIGSIMLGIYLNKKPVVAPRYKKFGENIDDHQVQIALRLAVEGMITTCLENENLIEKIEENLQAKTYNYDNPEKRELLNFLEGKISR